MRWACCKGSRSRVRSKQSSVNVTAYAATHEDLTDFPELRVVNHHTWLYHNKEEGQTVQDFINRPDRNAPDEVRKVIYLQPFGDITSDELALLPIIQQYARAFFQMEVRIKPPRPLNKMPAALSTREHPPGNTQYFTRPIFTALRKLLPADAFCVEGITVCDLFSRHGRSFVFGSAKLSGRVGVYSFHRHRPSFYNNDKSDSDDDNDDDDSADTDEDNSSYSSDSSTSEDDHKSRKHSRSKSASTKDTSTTEDDDSSTTSSSSSSAQGDGQRRGKGVVSRPRRRRGMSDSDRQILIKRAIKTCVHEISHMFFMKHCVYYNCAMNGSIDIIESDRRSAHLCPVCLEKLQHATGCDLLQRYIDLEQIYNSLGMDEEAAFVSKRQRVILRALARHGSPGGKGKKGKKGKGGNQRGWFRFGGSK